MIINDVKEFEENNKGITLVDFFAEWCGPCKMLLPIINELESELKDVNILKVNIDDISELAAKYEVSTIPTLIYFKDGKEVKRTIGFKPKAEIISTLESLK